MDFPGAGKAQELAEVPPNTAITPRRSPSLAEGAPGREAGSDSYTAGRGSPGRDHGGWALTDE